jgi:hypothetical protein
VGFPFPAQPLEVAVTEEDVYARFRDRRAARVSLALLRTVLRGPRGELSYIFGRRTRLLLRHSVGCPVEALLEARLPAV